MYLQNLYNLVTRKYKSYERTNKIEPADAARLDGDKYFFYDCKFLGYQDTLLDNLGRHFFKNCYIQGEVALYMVMDNLIMR